MRDVRTAGGVDEQLIQRLAKILSDPLRMEIHYQCTLGEVSPRSFRQGSGGPSLAKIQQAFSELEQFGWIERVPGRGGPPPEEFDRRYRSEEPMLVDRSTWVQLPRSVRSSVTLRVVESLARRTKDAMKAGTIDAREDSHMTVTPLALDREGWDAVIGHVEDLFENLSEERRAAEARLAESGEEPILATVGLFAFESPRH